MTHPALLLFARNPELALDHAQAYADLVSGSVRNLASAYGHRLMYRIAGLVTLTLSLIFCGVAVMLWGAGSNNASFSVWTVFSVPLVSFAIATVLLFMASRMPSGMSELNSLNLQVKADLALLRSTSGS